MALSLLDVKRYYEYFDIFVDTDGKRLNCFKCGKDLIHVSSSIGYRCVNLHAYSYTNIVMTHAQFMASLVTSLSDNKVCDS